MVHCPCKKIQFIFNCTAIIKNYSHNFFNTVWMLLIKVANNKTVKMKKVRIHKSNFKSIYGTLNGNGLFCLFILTYIFAIN